MMDASNGKNALYWAYNLPLQYWPSGSGYPARIVNYMPRKERCETLDIEEVIGEQSHTEFFQTAAEYLRNLAALMDVAALDPTQVVYYHDSDIAEAPSNA